MLELTGQRFNMLKVIGFAFIKNEESYWKCKCDCGKETIKRGWGIKSGKPKSCGCIQPALVGRYRWDKHPQWKQEKDLSYGGKHYRIKQVVKKPELCSRCNLNKATIIHNLSGKYKMNNDDWRWICKSCHMKIHNIINNIYGKQNNNK